MSKFRPNYREKHHNREDWKRSKSRKESKISRSFEGGNEIIQLKNQANIEEQSQEPVRGIKGQPVEDIRIDGDMQTNEWQKVVDNITVKAGEYQGTKDISRMRDAIARKSKDAKWFW